MGISASKLKGWLAKNRLSIGLLMGEVSKTNDGQTVCLQSCVVFSSTTIPKDRGTTACGTAVFLVFSTMMYFIVDCQF